MIKKQIIFFSFLLGFSFSQYSPLQQTGIFSKEGEAKFGAWINASKNDEMPGERNFKSVSLDYIFPIGLEILMGFNNNGKGGSQRVERIIMSYHYKRAEKNYSMHIGKENYEKRIDERYDNYTCFECSVFNYKSINAGFSWYNNKYLAVESSYITYKKEINHLQKIDGSYLSLSVGKYQKVTDRIIIGITYTSHLGHGSTESFFPGTFQEHLLKPMMEESMSHNWGFSFGYLY